MSGCTEAIDFSEPPGDSLCIAVQLTLTNLTGNLIWMTWG